jgi:HPr kinase/phosphorylase
MPPQSIPPITVETFLSEAKSQIPIRLAAGAAGVKRPIRHPRIQKSGLALAGHFEGVVPTRVQVLGDTEMTYLEALAPDARGQSCRGFFSLGLSCVVLTRDRDPPKALAAAAEATSTPILVSATRSSKTVNALHAILDDQLAPHTQLHGVLVDVFGVGLLLMGKSGIGKSECAIELVLRGHRLVADDVVRCDWRPPGMVFGAPPDLLRHHIEVRGLGVLNIKDMFGVTAVRERKRIDVVVRLEEWKDEGTYDRLGIEDRYHAILGTPIRMLTVPVRPGRDMGSIVEMAARNELLRRAGKNPAREFAERIESRAIAGAESFKEAVDNESAAIPPVSSPRVAPAPHSDEALPPLRRSNESAAWIVASKPRRDDDG